MPGARCAVAACNNNYVDAKKKNTPLSFHSFPKDKRLRKVWMKFCRRADSWNPATGCICSAHFNNEDFEIDLRSSLMNILTKKKLKKTAVPRIYVKPSEMHADTLRQARAEIRDRKKTVQDLLKKYEERMTAESIIITETETFEEKYNKILKENDILKRKCSEGSMTEESITIVATEETFEETCNKILKENDILRTKCSELQESNRLFKQEIEKLKKDLSAISERLCDSAPVEIIVGRNKYDLKDLVIIEEKKTDEDNFKGFLYNLGKTITAKFVKKSYKCASRNIHQEVPMVFIEKIDKKNTLNNMNKKDE